jgi:hypothetical protein
MVCCCVGTFFDRACSYYRATRHLPATLPVPENAQAEWNAPGSNHAMELTAGRFDFHFQMTSTFEAAAERAFTSGSSSCSR